MPNPQVVTGPNFSGKSCYAKQVRGGGKQLQESAGPPLLPMPVPWAPAAAACVCRPGWLAGWLPALTNQRRHTSSPAQHPPSARSGFTPVCCTQVALITFLAHVGSFVPATSARVGLTDRIFTRLASREAAAVPQVNVLQVLVLNIYVCSGVVHGKNAARRGAAAVLQARGAAVPDAAVPNRALCA